MVPDPREALRVQLQAARDQGDEAAVAALTVALEDRDAEMAAQKAAAQRKRHDYLPLALRALRAVAASGRMGELAQ
jgi:hypothetical protein